MDKVKIKNELIRILGKDNVFDDEETLSKYSSDMTENEPSTPDFVVKVRDTHNVQEILKLANCEKIPVTPCAYRTNLGGLSFASEGGIIIDLTLMNKILEVKEREMYAQIEPGVTYGEMKEYLDKNYPSLRFGYPLSPPQTSIVANCLLDGLANLSLRYGCTSEWIQGIEAVLPTGEVVKCGAGAVSPYWFSRAPFPDLTGLFVSWQGTTGIVTKMAVMLFPNPSHRYQAFFMCYSISDAFYLMEKFAKLNVCDDIGGVSWTCGKMLFGVKKPLYRSPDEPEFYIYVDLSGNTRREIRAKISVIEETISGKKVEGPLKVEDIVMVDSAFEKFSSFPTYLDFLLDAPGGGLTWVGTYGPISNWEKAARRCADLMQESGFPPTIVSRPMKGGHFVILRLITLFDKKNKEEVEKVKKLNNVLCDIILEEGFIPYKAPRWVVKKFLPLMDKGYYELLSKIKSTLDPNRIMNPGKWLL